MNLLKTGIAAIAAISIGTGMSASEDRPLQLKYDRPAQYFEETLILGNGNLGASVYGGVEHEKISLNDITLWTGEPDTVVAEPDAYKYIPLVRGQDARHQGGQYHGVGHRVAHQSVRTPRQRRPRLFHVPPSAAACQP